MHKSIKWSPAKPQKKPDNIISSKARETGNIGFKPSYLAERTENMKFIMSNEYMRLWFNERAHYEKETYSREKIIKEESKIKRRFVQRMMTYKKPNKNELGQCTKKEGTNEQSLDYSKLKYKPVCPKEKGYNQEVLKEPKKIKSKIESPKEPKKIKSKIESPKEPKKIKSKIESRQSKVGKGDEHEAAICVVPCCPAAKTQ